MSIHRLIYPGFWFGKSSRAEALTLAHLGAGGFCFYGGTSQEVRELTRELRKESPLEHLFICADYEDGLGRWLPDTVLLPSNMALGASGSETLAYQKGLLTAEQALDLGVDWVFAPVADLANNPANPIVNTRSFGRDPRLVTRLCAAFMDGLKAGGVLNCLKHFPGHGDTRTDSHLALPVLNRTREQLEEDLTPFRLLLDKADGVMAGHLLIPALDAQNPASLSPAVLKDLLIQEMGYTGCILTDALVMKAIGDDKQASLRALQAGAHILLAMEKPLELAAFLDEQRLAPELIARSAAVQDALAQKVTALKAQFSPVAPRAFNRVAAPQCAALQGTLFTLQPGDEAAYLETGNDENYAASSFLNALTRRGVRVKPFNGYADKLIAVSFSNYKSFKGRVNLTPAQKEQLEDALKNANQSVVISFGNPYSILDLSPEPTGKLFLFSPADEFQQCAADLLSGRQQPRGVLPF